MNIIPTTKYQRTETIIDEVEGTSTDVVHEMIVSQITPTTVYYRQYIVDSDDPSTEATVVNAVIENKITEEGWENKGTVV